MVLSTADCLSSTLIKSSSRCISSGVHSSCSGSKFFNSISSPSSPGVLYGVEVAPVGSNGFVISGCFGGCSGGGK